MATFWERGSSLVYLQSILEKRMGDYYVSIYSLPMEICLMVKTLIFHIVCVCGLCRGQVMLRTGWEILSLPSPNCKPMGFLGVTVSKPQREWNRSNNGDVPPAAAVFPNSTTPVSRVYSLRKYLLPLCAVVTLDCSTSTTSKALLSWHNGVIVSLLFLG